MLEGTAGASLSRGGHVLVPAPDPDVVLVASGSEVALCVAAAELLAQDGVVAQVTSLACWDLLAEQPEEVVDELLPPGVPALSVEAASTFGWDRWAEGCMGIDRFGASAPGDVVLEQLGFTPAGVADRARALIADMEDPE